MASSHAGIKEPSFAYSMPVDLVCSAYFVPLVYKRYLCGQIGILHIFDEFRLNRFTLEELNVWTEYGQKHINYLGSCGRGSSDDEKWHFGFTSRPRRVRVGCFTDIFRADADAFVRSTNELVSRSGHNGRSNKEEFVRDSQNGF